MRCKRFDGHTVCDLKKPMTERLNLSGGGARLSLKSTVIKLRRNYSYAATEGRDFNKLFESHIGTPMRVFGQARFSVPSAPLQSRRYKADNKRDCSAG